MTNILSVEDTYTPEDGVSFYAGELYAQLREMNAALFASGNGPEAYVTVGPDRLHVGRVTQIVETLSDGSEVRSIHLELINPESA